MSIKIKIIYALFRIVIFMTTFFVSLTALAHPGNTASDGCHYCRTNCEKWGEVYGERHCHNGTSSTVSTVSSSSKDNSGYWILAIVAGIVITYFIARRDK